MDVDLGSSSIRCTLLQAVLRANVVRLIAEHALHVDGERGAPLALAGCLAAGATGGARLSGCFLLMW
eukprot:15338982-Alexandrium_andersonii.AAC.1